jgi:hypothetical protein
MITNSHSTIDTKRITAKAKPSLKERIEWMQAYNRRDSVGRRDGSEVGLHIYVYSLTAVELPVSADSSAIQQYDSDTLCSQWAEGTNLIASSPTAEVEGRLNHSMRSPFIITNTLLTIPL